ncbi:MAG: polyprenyl synthetase family protein [Clostridiales bacterium]|nr:polyprenyl synthetase family protein [Clostridiales bacterium]
MSAKEMLMEYAALIEPALENAIPLHNGREKTLADAMRYSVLDGGKRIRPALVLEFCRICGGNIQDAVPFACAVEMIHSYSLVHDDLPCMDNDLLRRGKPSTHAKYGEAMALLAGDALLTHAFAVMLTAPVQADRAVAAAGELAKQAGYLGMVGGQVIDLESEGKTVGLDTLKAMDRGKTCALIEAACAMGCLVAGASEEELDACRSFARHVGFAFQIVDDILDVTSDPETLGKTVGKDAGSSKATYVTIFGLEEAKKAALEETRQAKEALSIFGDRAGRLLELADMLATRNK